MGSGFAKKKKEAKLFRESMAEMQEKIQNTSVTASAGAGLVTVTLNGKHEMEKITLQPACVDPDDIEGLEDLIKAAYNEATKKLMKDSVGDMGMGGFDPTMLKDFILP